MQIRTKSKQATQSILISAFLKAAAKFLDNKVIEINNEQITADKIIIAVGTRPTIPDIPGLAGTPFMTSTEALRNTSPAVLNDHHRRRLYRL